MSKEFKTGCEDDGNRGRCAFHCHSCRSSSRNHNSRPQSNELFGQSEQPGVIAICKTSFENDVLPDDVASTRKAVTKRAQDLG